jgi:nucleoside-triphosphatase THEP1
MTALEQMRLAAITYDRGFDIDCLLVTVCERLSRRGFRLGGLLQISTGAKGGCASTVHVVDLRTNTTFDIWEERGPCAKGCRLDERGLAAASHAIDKAIADRVDLVIMNRFGRAESLGRGLLASFSSAVSADVPVLTAVRAPYDLAWTKFHGGLGRELPAEVASIIAWSEGACVGGRPDVIAASHARVV